MILAVANVRGTGSPTKAGRLDAFTELVAVQNSFEVGPVLVSKIAQRPDTAKTAAERGTRIILSLADQEKLGCELRALLIR